MNRDNSRFSPETRRRNRSPDIEEEPEPLRWWRRPSAAQAPRTPWIAIAPVRSVGSDRDACSAPARSAASTQPGLPPPTPSARSASRHQPSPHFLGGKNRPPQPKELRDIPFINSRVHEAASTSLGRPRNTWTVRGWPGRAPSIGRRSTGRANPRPHAPRIGVSTPDLVRHGHELGRESIVGHRYLLTHDPTQIGSVAIGRAPARREPPVDDRSWRDVGRDPTYVTGSASGPPPNSKDRNSPNDSATTDASSNSGSRPATTRPNPSVAVRTAW